MVLIRECIRYQVDAVGSADVFWTLVMVNQSGPSCPCKWAKPPNGTCVEPVTNCNNNANFEEKMYF